MTVTNMAKNILLRDNYFSDWGGSRRQHNYSTREMLNDPYYTPMRLNRLHSRSLNYLWQRLWK
jgi:hypothetical protein